MSWAASGTCLTQLLSVFEILVAGGGDFFFTQGTHKNMIKFDLENMDEKVLKGPFFVTDPSIKDLTEFNIRKQIDFFQWDTGHLYMERLDFDRKSKSASKFNRGGKPWLQGSENTGTKSICF